MLAFDMSCYRKSVKISNQEGSARTSGLKESTCQEWLKCKIRGGGTVHLDLPPPITRPWSCAFPL